MNANNSISGDFSEVNEVTPTSQKGTVRWGQAQPARLRAVRLALGHGGFQPRPASRPAAQGRPAQRLSSGRYRDPRPTPAAAGERAWPLRVHDRARRTGDPGVVQEDGRAVAGGHGVPPWHSGTPAPNGLANDGGDPRALQHYLGHRSIQSTVRYTELSPKRFENFWRD